MILIAKRKYVVNRIWKNVYNVNVNIWGKKLKSFLPHFFVISKNAICNNFGKEKILYKRNIFLKGRKMEDNIIIENIEYTEELYKKSMEEVDFVEDNTHGIGDDADGNR